MQKNLTIKSMLCLLAIILSSCSSNNDDTSISLPSEVYFYGQIVPVQLLAKDQIPSWAFEKVEKNSTVYIYQGEWNGEVVYITYPVLVSSQSDDILYGVIHNNNGGVISIKDFGDFNEYPPIKRLKCIYYRKGSIY